jgi:hypothetical protein
MSAARFAVLSKHMGGYDMKKSTFAEPSRMWYLAALVLWCASVSIKVAAATDNADSPPAAGPSDMVTVLQAAGPHPSLGDNVRVPARLVGTWDVEYTDFSKDGKAVQRSGEYILEWVMDGRALQDLWIVNPSGTRKEREVYTTLIYFDPNSRTWRATFVDPEGAAVFRFTGGSVGDDRLALETQEINSEQQTRWSYSNVRNDSFVWRDEGSSDGGKTWRLKAEYHMKRRGAAPPVQ